MSLATRCTACGTIFRVVEDQLRVSEGWVRCGRCAEVFDAREQLFDIDLEAPPPWPPVPAPAALATPAMDLAMRDERQHAPAPAKAVVKAAPEPDSNIRRPPPAPSEVDFAAEPEHPRHELSDPGNPRMDFGAHDSIVAAAMDSRHEPRWIDEPAPAAPSAPSPQDAAPPWTEPEIEQQIEQEVQEEMARLLAAQAAEQAQAKQRAEIAAEIESAMLAESERQAQLKQGTAAAHEPKASNTVEEDDHGFQATTLGAGGELLAEAEAAAQANSASASAAVVATGTQTTGSAELPEFLRPTRSHALWGRLWVRLSLGLLCGLALVALGAQATWQFRDALVARYPQLRPDLQAFCELARCELKPWQRLESFSVDSSALSQAGSGHHYKLALSLRNKSEFELALPWVELSLTDASGQLIARRALSPQDFGLSKDALAASSELPVNTLLTTGERAVSGYSVELFYP